MPNKYKTITKEEQILTEEHCQFCDAIIATEHQLRFRGSEDKLEFSYDYYEGDHGEIATCKNIECVIKALEEITRYWGRVDDENTLLYLLDKLKNSIKK